MIIATDLDGTLLASDTKISPENLAAIGRLRRKGIATVPVTGRTFYEIPEELINCEDIEYFIYSNGAGICKKGKDDIFLSVITPETAAEIFSLLNSYDTFIELYTKGRPVVDKNKFSEESFGYYKIDPAFLPELRRSRIALSDFEFNFPKYSQSIEMFDVFFKNMSEREDCRKKLTQLYPYTEITTSMENNLEIMNKGVNKGSGLTKLCALTGADINQVYALGDSRNDLTLFGAVKHRFAISNACEKLKKISTNIICSNDENVICYMEKYFEMEE